MHGSGLLTSVIKAFMNLRNWNHNRKSWKSLIVRQTASHFEKSYTIGILDSAYAWLTSTLGIGYWKTEFLSTRPLIIGDTNFFFTYAPFLILRKQNYLARISEIWHFCHVFFFCPLTSLPFFNAFPFTVNKMAVFCQKLLLQKHGLSHVWKPVS